ATPPITYNVLEGITRLSLMQLILGELNLNVVERQIDRTEVYLADEMFFSGTGVQISAITRIDHRKVGSGNIGENTTLLRKMYSDVVHGRFPKYRQWCHPVFSCEPDLTSNRPPALSVK